MRYAQRGGYTPAEQQRVPCQNSHTGSELVLLFLLRGSVVLADQAVDDLPGTPETRLRLAHAIHANPAEPNLSARPVTAIKATR